MVDSRIVIAEYLQRIEHYRTLATRIGEELKRLLNDAGIMATVAWRAKAADSLRGKLNRGNFAARLDAGKPLGDAVGDLAAVRICVYRAEDITSALEILSQHFQIIPGSVLDMAAQRAQYPEEEPRHWYRAVHAQVRLLENTLRASDHHLCESQCEVQICSLFSHVWNEVDHDIRYKPQISPSADMEALLVELGKLTARGDELVSEVLTEFGKHRQSSREHFINSVRDLETAMIQFQTVSPTVLAKGRSQHDIWEALYKALRKARVNRFGDLWDSIDPDRFSTAHEWIQTLNEPSRVIVRKLGRAVMHVSTERYIWLREDIPSHRVLVSLLPKLAWAFTSQDSAIAKVARTAILQGLVPGIQPERTIKPDGHS